jgi:hypothetical protein
VAITLGALTLPAGLVWSDEFARTTVAQTWQDSLTGATIIQVGIRPPGAARPITLAGWSSGRDYSAWITRANLLILQTALNAAVSRTTALTLTLHDARTFTVIARHEPNAGPLTVDPLPVYKDLPPANPGSQHWYIIREIRLLGI